MKSTKEQTSLPKSTPPPRLLTFWSGGWVILLAMLAMLITAGGLLVPVWRQRRTPVVGDGVHVESYGFDLSRCVIPRGQISAAGVAKDQIPALRQVRMIAPQEVEAIRRREHIKFLVDDDLVIGVVLEGQARAYPLRVLVQHEVANDSVGNVPIAVTYSPLCDAVVVFDRRVGGRTIELGMSGLLVNSNPLYFDRQPDAKQESLWSQLLGKAVAGPAAGETLTRAPHALTTWRAWRAAHPETLVLAGESAYLKLYAKEPYGSYFASDVLRFPVAPLWNDPRLAKKTPVTVTRDGAAQWQVAPRQLTIEPGDRIECFLFAWYAQRPEGGFRLQREAFSGR